MYFSNEKYKPNFEPKSQLKFTCNINDASVIVCNKIYYNHNSHTAIEQ